jgi:hypothetical protein
MANPPPGHKKLPLPGSGGKPKNTKPGPTTTQAHDVLLALLIEATGIVIVVTVAGISDSVANLMLVFAIGLWLVFLVMNAETVAGFTSKLTNIESGATQ